MDGLSLLARLAAAALILTVASVASAQEPAPAPTTPEAWRAAARGDLERLRALLHDDTPVAVDRENPRMRQWFERGYRQARARVQRVHDSSSYFYALVAYTNGFQDPHLALAADTPWKARWPGFIATARGDDAIVFYRDETDAIAPAPGARIVSCDGRSLPQLLERIVFPFFFNSESPAHRRLAVPRLFLGDDNIFAPAPRHCIVEENGVHRTLSLNWRAAPDSAALNSREAPGDATFWAQDNLAGLGPSAQFGVTTPAEGIVWIGAPTFHRNQDEQLQALVREIEAKAEAIRNGRAVVIDIRGNGGGSSAWGEALARAVWGEKAVEAAQARKPRTTALDWRASARNRDYIAAAAPQLVSRFGENSSAAQWAREVMVGLGEAVARGEPMWRQTHIDMGGNVQTPSGDFRNDDPRMPSWATGWGVRLLDRLIAERFEPEHAADA